MEKLFQEPPRLYKFDVKYYFNTFLVCSDIFSEAINTNDYSDRRHVEEHLMYGEYPDWITFPVVCHQSQGRYLRDIIARGWPHDPFIISDRIVKIFEENHVTGWKTYPVEIYDKKGNLISGYQGFSVTGRGGSMKENKWRRSDWDGSDIFIIGNIGHYVTERVKILLEENKIKSAEFFPLSIGIL